MSGGGVNYQPGLAGPTPREVFVTVTGSAASDLVYMLTQPSSDLPVHDALQFKPSAHKNDGGGEYVGDTAVLCVRAIERRCINDGLL